MKSKIKSWQITLIIILSLGLVILIYVLINRSPNLNDADIVEEVKEKTILTKEEQRAVKDFFTESENQEQTEIEGVHFIGQTPSFPKEMTVYKNNYAQLATSQIENRLQTAFGLQKKDVSGIIFWEGIDFSMDYSRDLGAFLITANFEEDDNESAVINTESAGRIALNFVNQLWPESNNIALVPSATTFETRHGLNEVVEADKAEIASFSFSRVLEGYPVFLLKSSALPYQVWVNKNDEVVKAMLSPHFFEITAGQKTSLIPVEEAVANINDGLALIVKTEQEEFVPYNQNEVVAGEMTKVELQYRELDDKQTIVPFYSFEGNLTDKNGVAFQGVIITPAIIVE